MRLPRFSYCEPKTIKEACSLLSQYKDEARVMAGGTDLLGQMREGKIMPRYLIGLKSIPDLNYIRYDEAQGLRIGTLVTLNDLATSPIIRDKFDILFQAVQQMASVQIRNLATIGGNLCNAVPSADTASPLITLGAMLKLVSQGGGESGSSGGFLYWAW